jgi:hypothetical protein
VKAQFAASLSLTAPLIVSLRFSGLFDRHMCILFDYFSIILLLVSNFHRTGAHSSSEILRPLPRSGTSLPRFAFAFCGAEVAPILFLAF